MGGKLLWTGLVMILDLPRLGPMAIPWELLGAFVMIGGCVLMWLDK